MEEDLKGLSCGGESPRKKDPIMKKLKALGKVVAVVAILMLGLFGGYKFGLWMSQEKSVVDVDDVREELAPIASLATYEYRFTDILHLSDAHTVLNFDIPFTRNHYVATVEGTVYIGVKDVESIGYSLETDFDGSLKSVVVKLPHCEAWSATIDHGSLEVLVDLNGVANDITKEELMELFTQVESEQEFKAASEDIVSKADARLQEMITTHIRALYGDYVSVGFEYIDRDE